MPYQQPIALALRVLALLAHAFALASASVPGPPRPRIYVYQMPANLTMEATTEKGVHPGTVILDALYRSNYYERDPSKADYFWIPGSGRFRNKEVMIEVLQYVRLKQPWWNMTVSQGQARHILVTTRDSDPGQSFGWPLYRTDEHIPTDLNPAHPDRNIIFLSFNGMRDGPFQNKADCVVCFQPGKDIMMPKFQGICNGPLCGFDLQTLRQKSLWALPPEQLQDVIGRPRKRLMFFGGSTLDHHDFTGRGGVALFYGTDKRYLVQVSRTSKRRIRFPDAMLNSDFCFSPLGGNGGPTDRYVSAVMFGCIPILLNTSHIYKDRIAHSLPLEEVLPWHTFATVIDNYDITNLDNQLQCLAPNVAQMRTALKEVWPSLVWTTLYGRFLNESGRDDAFHTLMRVLESRIAHAFAPPPETAARFTHPPPQYPCRPDQPRQPGH